MCCGSAFYLAFGLLEIYLIVMILIKIGAGDDIDIWVPGGGFMTKYAESQ
jgi:hypothetical protein